MRNMNRCFVLFSSVFLHLCSIESTNLLNRQQCPSRHQPGDFRLAGLFSIHTDQLTPCVNRLSATGVFQAEAMIFALKQINSRSDILDGINFGYEIWDDGWSESMVMSTALSLLQGFECTHEEGFKKDEDLLGIVGTSRSSTTILISRLARIYRSPVISYYATSDELSNKDQFPYFLRTVPPDTFQVEAIVEMISYFGWDYIAVIHSVDSYGIQGSQQLYSKTIIHGICVAFSVPISVSPNRVKLDDLIDTINRHNKLKVIVLFAASQVAYDILDHLKTTGLPRDITWLASDGISSDLIDHGLATVGRGGLYMDFYSHEISEFEEYIKQLDPALDTLSPWLVEYCGCQTDNCTELISKCLSNLSKGFSASYVIAPVIDAVYAFAIALDEVWKSNCFNSTPISVCNMGDIGTDELFGYLLNVSYLSQFCHVRFDSNGNPHGKYVVKNLQLVNGSYYFNQVGVWNSRNTSNRWTINDRNIQFADGSSMIPTVTCKVSCPPGSYAVPMEMKCCWDCQKCLPNEIVANSSCEACPLTYWPNDDYTACDFINPSHLDWGSPILVTIITLDCIALLLCGLTIAGISKYREHFIIKATSRELSAVNLIGLLLALFTPFMYLSIPCTASCTAGHLCLVTSFCLIFAPTTLKVNRIYRIFDAGKKSVRAPGFVSPKYQMLLTAAIISPQLVIAIPHVIIKPTTTEYIYFPNQKRLEEYCVMDTFFLIGSVYNSAIILVCCFYAFKARKVPDNYNESRFIALSVYSTVVVCLAAIPVFITAVTALLKVATVCFVLLVNVYISLLCLYLPKLYAIHFDKTEDDNKNTINRIESFNNQSNSKTSKAQVAPAQRNM